MVAAATFPAQAGPLNAYNTSCIKIDHTESLSDMLPQCGAYPQTGTANHQLRLSPDRDKRFNEILAYTFLNYDDHITLEQVAKIANLTKESFCRYFKSRARKTYMEFLTELRITKACQLIRHGNIPVKDVGYSCGFDSLSNFYDRFKKITKLSPLEFKCLHNAER